MGCVYYGLLEAICEGKRGSSQREKKVLSTQIPSDLNKDELFN